MLKGTQQHIVGSSALTLDYTYSDTVCPCSSCLHTHHSLMYCQANLTGYLQAAWMIILLKEELTCIYQPSEATASSDREACNVYIMNAGLTSVCITAVVRNRLLTTTYS